ncbi:hypothetical protein P7K49_020228 [Saguinus oedipus]|uniref:Uncharacterized protein n=1 Tax=Saguinus oedipus TaxID=9490 RepID=A0ABQ9V0B6_SAGOE|nr:hypothetical protein P7K49_020228 [Saguinus oedipus]
MRKMTEWTGAAEVGDVIPIEGFFSTLMGKRLLTSPAQASMPGSGPSALFPTCCPR